MEAMDEFAEFLFEKAHADYVDVARLADKALESGLVTSQRIFLSMLSYWVELVNSPKSFNHDYEVFVTDAESTYRGTTIEVQAAGHQRKIRAIRVYRRRTVNG
jgi:hypothetical protein